MGETQYEGPFRGDGIPLGLRKGSGTRYQGKGILCIESYQVDLLPIIIINASIYSNFEYLPALGSLKISL